MFQAPYATKIIYQHSLHHASNYIRFSFEKGLNAESPVFKGQQDSTRDFSNFISAAGIL